MAKRIHCKVVKTALLRPDGDLLVARPHYSSPPTHTDNSVAHIPVHKPDKLFAEFSRQGRILDYYA